MLWSETPDSAHVAFFTSRILNHFLKDTFHIYLQYYCNIMPHGVILRKYMMPVLIVLVYICHDKAAQLEITESIKQSYLN